MKMSEKLPEPYGWLYYGSPDGPLFRRDHPEGLYWLCVSSAPVYSHEQMRIAVAEAADLRRERDELAARLAAIEAAAPERAEPATKTCDLCGEGSATLRSDPTIGGYRECDHCGSEYVGPADRPCRRGPEGCPDRVSCPRGEGQQ